MIGSPFWNRMPVTGSQSHGLPHRPSSLLLKELLLRAVSWKSVSILSFGAPTSSSHFSKEDILTARSQKEKVTLGP